MSGSSRRSLKNKYLVMLIIPTLGITLILFHNHILRKYSADFKFASVGDPHHGRKLANATRRKFINYTSSQWEKLWIEYIDAWQKQKSICARIMQQREQLEEFLGSTCTTKILHSDWCYHDDTHEPFWVNPKTLEASTTMPDEVAQLIAANASKTLTNIRVTLEASKLAVPVAQPFQIGNLPEDENGSPAIFSKFVFFDEVKQEFFTEYIEPLVSHLRHPLARCHYREFYLLKRSYVIPTPRFEPSAKKYYFDAGASVWDAGLGGPSLSYFTPVWLRHGIDFDEIQAWEGSTPPETFYSSVPEEYKDRTVFYQKWVATSADEHSTTTPFLPTVIRNSTKKEDYVFFKLDIDSGAVEMGIVNHLLSSDNDDLEYIDEFAFEHHVEGNYLLTPNWGIHIEKGASILDSYKMFLKLRNKGVRAHSWV